MTTSDDRTDDALDAVSGLVARHGVGGRRLRQALAMLTEGAYPLDELIRACALPRRTVEALLRAVQPDLDSTRDGFAIRAERSADYRKAFGYAQLRASSPADPLAGQLASRQDVVEQLRGDIAAAPAAREALDHVAATADTVLRRALWLDATFDLDGARLLCVGDHDLSSLALGAISPGLSVTVVDVDERLLEFIEARAASRGYDVRCRYADFRFGLPESAVAAADLVLTDPPYTPDGVRLFLGRGLQGLRDRANGALVMAYGFSPAHPALGVKVQRAVHDLDLAVEAILPAFNRYHGAQAIGSASDLYVCRPTARTWQILDRQVARAAGNIYTHGAQSVEGGAGELAEAVAGAVIRLAAGDVLIAGAGWPASAGKPALSLEDLFGSGIPATRRRPVHLAANLMDDPGSWLLRALLAANADRLALLVPNNHPDLANETSQRALIDLVAPKYTVRLNRTTPTSRHAVVSATAVEPDERGGAVRRHLLSHAHGKIGNVWREALIQHSGRNLTKNAARALVARTATQPSRLDARLLDLPRHAISLLLREVDGSVNLA
ncbi:bis-aminopropyl spermidine synthase family protein [Actinophytocola sp.]|uniref:bis-aminopropyl spermidine synthase family protein n=1 Tax=Actinophytocola sp. TaxID=1872138 RepID=UPI002D7EE352|nr:bis-aminopropyl spermidine synthase family protein [Actinophytocola sp.]HET9141449.1 bis-aminopropyl spermidine synthase family protein [Actinophytocola sp.]